MESAQSCTLPEGVWTVHRRTYAARLSTVDAQLTLPGRDHSLGHDRTLRHICVVFGLPVWNKVAFL